MTMTTLDSNVDTTKAGTGDQSKLSADGVVHTRFGLVPFTPEQQVCFKGGLPGFPGIEQYQLEQVPHVEGDLMLLQSVAHADVAFFVLPLAQDGSVIDPKDLEAAANQLGVKPAEMLVLTVVNLQRVGTALEKFVNIRAPIFIDINNQTGMQIVLNNPKYSLRLKLNN